MILCHKSIDKIKHMRYSSLHRNKTNKKANKMSLKQLETLLEKNVTSTWERLRGSDELLSFIERREQALALADTEDFSEL